MLTIGAPEKFAINYNAPETVENGLVRGQFYLRIGGRVVGNPAATICLSGMMLDLSTIIKDRRFRENELLFRSSAESAFQHLQSWIWEFPVNDGSQITKPDMPAVFWAQISLQTSAPTRIFLIDYKNDTRILDSSGDFSEVHDTTVSSKQFYKALHDFWEEIDRRWLDPRFRV